MRHFKPPSFVQPIHLVGTWQDDKNGDGTMSFVWWPDWYGDEMTLMEMNADNITFGRVKNIDSFYTKTDLGGKSSE